MRSGAQDQKSRQTKGPEPITGDIRSISIHSNAGADTLTFPPRLVFATQAALEFHRARIETISRAKFWRVYKSTRYDLAPVDAGLDAGLSQLSYCIQTHTITRTTMILPFQYHTVDLREILSCVTM